MRTGTASHPSLLRRVLSLAAVALAPLFAPSLSCTHARGATAYCVLESNALAGGLCFTECESRCNLEALAGCRSSTCVASCEASAGERPPACQDASYAYWRCQRLAGEPHVRCRSGAPVLTTPASVCAMERLSAQSACATRDAAPAPDGQLSSDASSDAIDAR